MVSYYRRIILVVGEDKPTFRRFWKFGFSVKSVWNRYTELDLNCARFCITFPTPNCNHLFLLQRRSINWQSTIF